MISNGSIATKSPVSTSNPATVSLAASATIQARTVTTTPAAAATSATATSATAAAKPVDGKSDKSEGRSLDINTRMETKNLETKNVETKNANSNGNATGPAASTKQTAAASAAAKATAAESAGRTRALEAAVGQIEKAFGKGSIMRFVGDNLPDIQGISTGTLSLDLALGGRGLPKGRIVEIFGPESSGKTTLALTVIANAQKNGGNAAFIDAEHALDPSWAKRLGVDLEEMLISQPDTGEQALEICELLVRSNAVDVIVIDSVAALIPRAEIEGEMGDSHVGLQARLMSQAMRKLTGAIAKSEVIVIFINQLREKIGVMFGSPETTTGGRALKFYSTIRIDIRRIGAIKDGENNVGNRVRAKVVKNKIAPPFREAEFDIMFNEGISVSGDLIDLAVNHGVVDKAGSWFSYGDVRLGQGREASKQFIRENPDLAAEIRSGIIAKRALNPDAAITPRTPRGGE
ncbi:MAG: Protein RecA [Planctomycetota bacterium]